MNNMFEKPTPWVELVISLVFVAAVVISVGYFCGIYE